MKYKEIDIGSFYRDFPGNIKFEGKQYNDYYWGDDLENGYDDVNFIKNETLNVEKLAAFNHMAVFFHWETEHGFLSDNLLKAIPDLPELLNDKNLDLRTVLRNKDTFNGKLRARHFKGLGKEFAKEYYRNFQHCVNRFAYDVLGGEAYNSNKCKGRAYLFLEYNEQYHKELNRYLDEAWEEFLLSKRVTQKRVTSLCAVLSPIALASIIDNWFEFCMDIEKEFKTKITHIKYRESSSDDYITKPIKSLKLFSKLSRDKKFKYMELLSLPKDYEDILHDYDLSIKLQGGSISYCEISVSENIPNKFNYKNYIASISNCLKILELEVNDGYNYSIYNYNMNCLILKNDKYYSIYNIWNLYRKKNIDDSNIANEIQSIREDLIEPAIVFETIDMGRGNLSDLQSYIGKVALKYPEENIPSDITGELMNPLTTIVISELEPIPDEIKGIKAITVFISKNTIEDFENENDMFCIRTYRDLNRTEPCNWCSESIKALPLFPKIVHDDLPLWLEFVPANFKQRIEKLEQYGIEYKYDIVENEYSVHKIGGYPSYIQNGADFDGYTFIFQITSDDNAEFCFEDDGNIYFFYNKELDDWKIHYDFY